MEYRRDIDGLRAIAVVLVVAFHFFPKQFPGGFLGVDVFFVISGFLITRLILGGLERGDFRFSEFYGRRARRIFPALALVLLFCFAVGWVYLLPADFLRLGKHIAASAALVPNLLFSGETGYFEPAAEKKPLLHLWSLGVEEQFYLAWPPLLFVLYRLSRGRRAWTLAGTWVLLLISLALSAQAIATQDLRRAFFLPQYRAWELLAGAVLAQLRTASPARWAHLGSVAGLGLIACSALTLDDSQQTRSWITLIPVLGAVAVIFFSRASGLSQRLLGNPLLVGIGLVSYPLYLWHWTLLSWVKVFSPARLQGVFVPALIAVSLAFSYLTYRWVETPMRRGKDGRRRALLAVFALFLAGVLGLSAYWNQGHEFRIPEVVRKISRPIDFEVNAIFRPGTCFLELGQHVSQFKDCEDGRDPAKPKLFLWGDSHAAHLYPGYRKHFSSHFNLIQRTLAACPPVLGFDWKLSPQCSRMNEIILAEIRRVRPDRLVISGHWLAYDLDQDLPRIEKTLQAIQRLGLKKVELIGPDPYWLRGLPQRLYEAYLSDTRRRLPQRLRADRMGRRWKLDQVLAEMAGRYGMDYSSPLRILCDAEGCLTRANEAPDSLISWDPEHFSVEGSEFVVGRFPSTLKVQGSR